jgi:general stress protein CsbA
MKFYGSIIAYIIMGVILGAGIYLSVKGSYWLLGVGVVAYLVAFAKLGCLPPDKSH